MVSYDKTADAERMPNGCARVFSTLKVHKSFKDGLNELPKALKHYTELSEDFKDADSFYQDGQ